MSQLGWKDGSLLHAETHKEIGMGNKGNEACFWAELVSHLIEEGQSTPKLQLERAIGPLLGFFIEEVVSVIQDGRTIIKLMPEFPLRKGDSFQSTNIDWLLYDKDKNEIIFLELKTSRSSFSSEQMETYNQFITEEGTPSPWTTLYENFNSIAERAAKTYRNEKYARAKDAIDRQKERCGNNISHARVKLIYLCPFGSAASAEEISAPQASFVTFKELSNKLSRVPTSKRSKNYWALELLGKFLRDLDEEHIVDLPKHPEKNYQGQVKFEDAVQLAREFGNDIIIGYMGGIDEFIKGWREKAGWKWDWAEIGRSAPGNKDPKNWIPGNIFLEVVGK